MISNTVTLQPNCAFFRICKNLGFSRCGIYHVEHAPGNMRFCVIYEPLPENQNTKSFEDQPAIIVGPENTVKTILNCS